jgi:hypothetical protein
VLGLVELAKAAVGGRNDNTHSGWYSFHILVGAHHISLGAFCIDRIHIVIFDVIFAAA